MGTKKNRLWAALALVAVTGFTACLKNDDNTPQRPRALFWFTGGFTGPQTYDIFDNNVKLNTQGAMPYAFLQYYQAVGGTHKFTIKKSGSDSVIAESVNVYDSLNSYQLILHGENSPTLTSFRDDFTGLSQSQPNIRFIHLAPTIDPVDFFINEKKIYSSAAYVGMGGFNTSFTSTEVSGPVTIKVKAVGKDSTIAQYNENVSLSPGGAYTFFLRGINGNTGDRKPAISGIEH